MFILHAALCFPRTNEPRQCHYQGSRPAFSPRLQFHHHLLQYCTYTTPGSILGAPYYRRCHNILNPFHRLEPVARYPRHPPQPELCGHPHPLYCSRAMLCQDISDQGQPFLTVSGYPNVIRGSPRVGRDKVSSIIATRYS